MTDTEFFTKLQDCYPRLTPSEKLVAEFLSRNLQVAAFLTCIDLGNAAGVSDSTVIRLANVLGFSGFAEMKKTLQGMVLKKLSARDRLSTTIAKVQGSSYLKEIYELEKLNLEATYKANPPGDIEQAVDMLHQARKIFVVGYGISSSVVRFLCSRLARIKLDVVEINVGAIRLVEKMAQAGAEDVILGFSFPSYAREKIKLFKYMQQIIGGKTILVSDRRLGELQAYSDLVLLANSDSLAFRNSITGAAMLANMLSVGLALKDGDKSLKQIARNQELADMLGNDGDKQPNEKPE